MAEARILVVYYSRSGTTRRIAEALAGTLNCETEEIIDRTDRAGILGYARSCIEALRKTPAAIAPARKDPSAYDLVIVGTPVWASAVSSPVRAYLAANKHRLPAVAFFCTLGGSGSTSAFAQMQLVAGKAPRACVAVTAAEVAAGRGAAALAPFVNAVTPRLTVVRGSPTINAA